MTTYFSQSCAECQSKCLPRYTAICVHPAPPTDLNLQELATERQGDGNMILIGISGKKGVGKDLLASFLADKYGFMNFPFAGELKEAVRRDFGLTKQHTDGSLKEEYTDFLKSTFSFPVEGGSIEGTRMWTPRDIMIEYGQFFRRFDSLWWVKKVFERIDSIDSYKTQANYPGSLRITISDVRFKNEADAIKERGGIVVRLNRPKELNIYKMESNDVSETDLDYYTKFDLELKEEKNLVPEQLRMFADTVMTYIENKAVVK